MSETIIVALIAFAGTAFGSVLSVFAANKLSNYKIDELKNQVEKHNSVIERVFHLEQKEALLEEKISVANHRINDLEAFTKEVKK